MKFLLRRPDTGEEHQLLEQKEYVVGRKNCDILIQNDNSISRKHAVLTVENNKVTIMDCESKYHTLRNDIQLNPNTKIALKHNDEIQFGVLNSKFVFQNIKYVTTASALNSEQREKLKKDVAGSYGKYIEKWTPECTHLTVEKITLTIKLLLALIDDKPLVTPQFWADYAKSVRDRSSPPEEKNYGDIPVAELLLNQYDFSPNPQRKTLFNGKVFIFSKEKVKKQMEDVLKSCGGECLAWDKNPVILDDIRKSDKEFLIIQTEEKEESVSLNSVIKAFAKDGKRTIPLSEIALAVVSCSCEKNCNPSYNKVAEIFHHNGKTQHLPQRSRVLAPETQSQDIFATNRQVFSTQDENLIIPPTVDELDMILQAKDGENNKRPQEEQGNDVNMKRAKIEPEDKRKKTDLEGASKSQTAPKRKASDDENVPPNKKVPNPFAVLACQTSTSKTAILDDDDDFKIIKSTNKTQTKNICLSLKKEPMEDNLFSSIKPLGNSTIVAAESIGSPEIQTKTIHRSKNAPVAIVIERPLIRTFKTERGVNNVTSNCSKNTTRTNVSNITWMSKSFDDSNVTLKTEDPELKRIEELFTECVRIEVKARFRQERSVCSVSSKNASVLDTSLGKNFKRFRKVELLHAQSTIISRKHCTRVGVGDTTEIQVQVSDNDEDDNVEIVAPTRTKKSAFKPKIVKKFDLGF